MVETQKTRRLRAREVAVAVLLGIALAAAGGCRNAADQANDAAIAQAKTIAATTGTAQRVVWTDRDGNTVTTIVQPPLPGQATQAVTTTTTHVSTKTTNAPAAAPAPAVGPVIGPVTGPANGPANGPVDSSGRPIRDDRYRDDRDRRSDQDYPRPQSQLTSPSGSTVGSTFRGEAPPASPSGISGGNVAANDSAGGPVITPIDVHVGRGTILPVRVNQRIDVKTARAGERFSGEVARPVERDGRVVIPVGTHVEGVIDAAHRRGHFKGRSILGLRLVSMRLNGETYGLDTRDNVRTKKGKGKRSAAFIGGGAGLGALVGGLASGGVGLLVGSAVGAGAGTALGGLTGNRDLVIPAETVVDFRLADDLVVQPR